MTVGTLRLLLLPLSFIYGAVVRIRGWLFDIGIFRTHRVDAFVCSVGNITAGGVGKTPVVELIVGQLRAHASVAILSRGYGRSSSGTVIVQERATRLADARAAGDELSQLADRFPDCLVIADEQRVRGARAAVSRGARTIVLDDGFQHRALARQADVVVLSAREVLEGEFLLPAGNRREPMSALHRADLLAVTRCADDQIDAVESILRTFGKPVVVLRTKVGEIVRASDGAARDATTLRGKSAIAFCGIGDPDAFEQTLAGTGVDVVRHIRYADHHWFSPADLDAIQGAWRSSEASLVLTTAKDAVRLRDDAGRRFVRECPVHVVAIRQEIVRGLDEFRKLIATSELA